MRIISVTCKTCKKEYRGNVGDYGEMMCSGEEGGGDGTVISYWESPPECKTKLKIVLGSDVNEDDIAWLKGTEAEFEDASEGHMGKDTIRKLISKLKRAYNMEVTK